jgi:hypothetical protein
MANNYGSGSDIFSINSFVQHFDKGFVYPNLFRATFSGNNIVNGKKMLSYACKSAVIPGVTFTEGKYYVDGYYRKFVTGADYDPVTFTFLCDASMEIIKVFDDWGSAIYNEGKFGFKEDYKCNILVEIFDRGGAQIYQANIVDAYPTSITSFDLSWDKSGTVMTYDISFNYLMITA